MMRYLLASATVVLSCLPAAGQLPPAPKSQPGTATRIGEQIDRGLGQLSSEFNQAWAEVRKSVEKMGIQGRVYGRLHWDKTLEGANLEVSVRDNQVVVISGTVASTTAKLKAEQLAAGTIGVNSVVNEVSVAAAK